LTENRDHFPVFDGVRALAASLVFVFHAWAIINISSLQNGIDTIGLTGLAVLGASLGHFGEVGVALFYLLSGFLIYRPFAKAGYAAGKQPNLTAFAIRRAARILPAYWVAVTIIGFVDPASYAFSWDGLINQYLFLGIYRPEGIIWSSNMFMASWTVEVEVAFYIFLPFWAAAMAKLRASTKRPLRAEMFALLFLASIGVVWKIVACTQISGGWFGSSFAVLPASIDVFAAGMALAVLSLLPEVKASKFFERVAAQGLACWLGAAAVFALLVWVGYSEGPFRGSGASLALGSGLLKIPVVVLILLPAIWWRGSRGGVVKLLGSRPVMWVGLVSYGLYLWQVFVIRHLAGPVLYGAEQPLAKPSLLMLTPISLVVYAATLVVAALSWYLLERHALSFGRKLAKRVEARRADVLSVP